MQPPHITISTSPSYAPQPIVSKLYRQPSPAPSKWVGTALVIGCFALGYIMKNSLSGSYQRGFEEGVKVEKAAAEKAMASFPKIALPTTPFEAGATLVHLPVRFVGGILSGAFDAVTKGIYLLCWAPRGEVAELCKLTDPSPKVTR